LSIREEVNERWVGKAFVPGDETFFPEVVPFLAVFGGAFCRMEVGDETSSGVSGLVWSGRHAWIISGPKK